MSSLKFSYHKSTTEIHSKVCIFNLAMQKLVNVYLQSYFSKLIAFKYLILQTDFNKKLKRTNTRIRTADKSKTQV